MTPFMTPERWRQVEPIFDRALDLPPEARPAYLDEACARDHVLRNDVESLLSADQDARGVLDRSPDSFLHLSAGALSGDEGLEPDALIGPYRVVRPLGQGGMGTVYLGERADGQFEQTVALKLIRAGHDSAAVHRRFLAERQILARLQHANIARLIDGGLTSSGQPWLAMDYVDGAPLLSWCDARRQSVVDRLGVFEQVAEAVRYAHQNLVVHRDIKPSNILVTDGGQARLLDFGIAKVLSPAPADTRETGDAVATETGVLLTPEYAAPELVRGEPVTTATDVYALGAVLYELVSGHRVHRFERRSPVEMVRVICEQEPEPPSVAAKRDPASAAARNTAPARLYQELRGDLDTIIMTALQKRPSRRYPTVDALLLDLHNYRRGLPISARPASLGYRTRKFIRRHRVGAAAGVTLAVALAGGVFATLWQARATAREAARAEAVKEFLIGLFRTADPAEARGREISARELLALGTTRVDSALAAQPAIREELLGDLARIHRSLGLYEAADTLAQRAAQLAQVTHGATSPEFAARLTEWGATSRLARRAARSDTLLRRALAIRQRVLGARHPDVATTLTELALTTADRGEIGAANDLARQAMDIDRRFFGPRDVHVARDLELLARLHAKMEGEYGLADSAYRASIGIFASYYDAGHPDVIRVQNGLAANLRNMRRYAAAESIHRDVLAKYRTLHPGGHPDIATALHDLGIVLGRQQRFAEAESAYIEAIETRRRLVGNDIHTLSFLNDLGVLRAEKGDLPGAEVILRETADGSRTELGAGHPQALSALGNLAVVLTRQKKLADAERVLREVVAARRPLPSEAPGLARSLTSLGVVLRDAKRYADAEDALREAESIAREKPEVRKSLLAAALAARGVSLVRQARFLDAEPVLREAVALRRSYLDSVATVRLGDERSWGDLLIRLGRFAPAESVLVPAFRASAVGDGNRSVRAELARLLVTLYERTGRRGEAQRYAADTMSRTK